MAWTNIHFNDNKQKLTQIAYGLFLENGYENTSINDIDKLERLLLPSALPPKEI